MNEPISSPEKRSILLFHYLWNSSRDLIHDKIDEKTICKN